MGYEVKRKSRFFSRFLKWRDGQQRQCPCSSSSDSGLSYTVMARGLELGAKFRGAVEGRKIGKQ